MNETRKREFTWKQFFRRTPKGNYLREIFPRWSLKGNYSITIPKAYAQIKLTKWSCDEITSLGWICAFSSENLFEFRFIRGLRVSTLHNWFVCSLHGVHSCVWILFALELLSSNFHQVFTWRIVYKAINLCFPHFWFPS